jgi:multimeric flavodoxin WrbA
LKQADLKTISPFDENLIRLEEIKNMEVTILGIVGSPRKGGNTEVMVNTALEAGKESGDVQTDMVTLAGRDVHPCKGCSYCWFHEGVCKIKDDAEEILQKMVKADGLIVGSPAYFGSMTATLKALFERCLKLNILEDDMGSTDYEKFKDKEVLFPLRNKVGGAIGVGGCPSGGQEKVITDIHAFFHLNDMIVVSDGGIRTPAVHPHFGGVGTARRKKEILQDPYGMASSKSVGMRVAEVAKLIKWGIQAREEKKR